MGIPTGMSRKKDKMLLEFGFALIKNQILKVILFTKRIILYLQIGMFSKDIIFLSKFAFKTRQIYSLDLFL